jgi:hypothetical protein
MPDRDRNELRRRLEILDARFNLSKLWNKPWAYWAESQAASRDDELAGITDYVTQGLYWFVGDNGIVIVTETGLMHALLPPGPDRTEDWRRITRELMRTGIPEVCVYTHSKPLRRCLRRRGFTERDDYCMTLVLQEPTACRIVQQT